jgi:hypothetical protein
MASSDSSSNVNYINSLTNVGAVILLFVCGVGIVTNSLNIRVCLGENTRKTKMGFYNLIIASFNINILVITVLSAFFSNSYQWACLLMPYTQRILYQMISWLNVMVSFDRLYLITYHLNNPNMRHQPKMKRKKPIIIVLVMFMVILSVNVSGLFYYVDTQQTPLKV